MGLQNTPVAERVHIGIFGKRNAGKSSVINAITGQKLAIVSDTEGTTTDPVLKTMEMLPLGPVVVIDTPGLDDVGELGAQRVEKAYQMLNKTDIALLVVDAAVGFSEADEQILRLIQDKRIPYLVVYNKVDLLSGKEPARNTGEKSIAISAVTKYHIEELKAAIAGLVPKGKDKPLIRDLLQTKDVVVLVTPIDASAPKGRLILPQQQTVRDILAADAMPILTKENTLTDTLQALGKPPAMVVTDSQVFAEVAAKVPQEIPLTSFSILFARYKGNLDGLVNGAAKLARLEDGMRILISEGCTHHRQCEDIGTVKLPRWIEEYTGKRLEFEFSSGTEFPDNLQRFDLIVHCGACMLNERELKYRMRCAQDAGVPMTNYGTAIACIKGILQRSLLPFR